MKHPILGGWKLESWTISLNSHVTYPFGEAPVGRILYTVDGQMSATIARAERPALSHPVPAKAPVEEKLAAFDSYFSYGGSFHIDGEEVVHRVELSLNPNFVGSEQRRRMRFDGDTLTLSADEETPKGKKHHSIRWRRAQN
ncbi:lipocalin-like domain-containing protein [Litorivivens sp.]|uniref:lipocalin-like domain-containing protein n=1 Tax=Litorivivens sp. TaxID=2020868 RepID=UPI003566D4D7